MLTLKRRKVLPEGICAASKCRKKANLALYLHLEKGPILLCPAHAEESDLEPVNDEDVIDTEGEEVVEVVVERPSMNLAVDATERELVAEANEAKDTLTAIEEMNIYDNEDMLFAAEMLAEIKGMYNSLEDRRKAATGPLNKALKEVRSWFKPATDYYKECERALKQKLADYHDEQEKLRRAALEHLQGAVDNGTREDVQEAVSDLTKAEEPEMSGLTHRTLWTFEIVDESKLPRQFLKPDESAIGIYVRRYREEAEIPGVRITPKTSVASKSK